VGGASRRDDAAIACRAGGRFDASAASRAVGGAEWVGACGAARGFGAEVQPQAKANRQTQKGRLPSANRIIRAHQQREFHYPCGIDADRVRL
jgi:hypothetical protein